MRHLIGPVAALALVLTSCSTSSPATAPATTPPATVTATVTAPPVAVTDPAAAFCATIRGVYRPSGWTGAAYADLDVRRVRRCGMQGQDLVLEWTLPPLDDGTDSDAAALSREIKQAVTYTQRDGPEQYRQLRLRAYLPIGGADVPASVMRVANVVFSHKVANAYDALGSRNMNGAWVNADIKSHVDTDLIGELGPVGD